MVGAAAAGDVGAVRVFAVPHERLVVPEAENGRDTEVIRGIKNGHKMRHLPYSIENRKQMRICRINLGQTICYGEQKAPACGK